MRVYLIDDPYGDDYKTASEAVPSRKTGQRGLWSNISARHCTRYCQVQENNSLIMQSILLVAVFCAGFVHGE